MKISRITDRGIMQMVAESVRVAKQYKRLTESTLDKIVRYNVGKMLREDYDYDDELQDRLSDFNLPSDIEEYTPEYESPRSLSRRGRPSKNQSIPSSDEEFEETFDTWEDDDEDELNDDDFKYRKGDSYNSDKEKAIDAVLNSNDLTPTVVKALSHLWFNYGGEYDNPVGRKIKAIARYAPQIADEIQMIDDNTFRFRGQDFAVDFEEERLTKPTNKKRYNKRK